MISQIAEGHLLPLCFASPAQTSRSYQEVFERRKCSSRERSCLSSKDQCASWFSLLHSIVPEALQKIRACPARHRLLPSEFARGCFCHPVLLQYLWCSLLMKLFACVEEFVSA